MCFAMQYEQGKRGSTERELVPLWLHEYLCGANSDFAELDNMIGIESVKQKTSLASYLTILEQAFHILQEHQHRHL